MNQELTLNEKASTRQSNRPQQCIPEVFELQVKKTPKGVAVTCNDEKLTYQELNERANQLAHHLRALGIKPETPVALYLERSPNMVIAILGVLKAGGAYVPIDLAYPKERLSFMLEDAQAPVLLTQSSLVAALPDHKAKVLCLDTDWAEIASNSPLNPVTLTKGDNAAYIIYTSGSTGKPKGVIVTHTNVVRLLQETEHWYGFNSNDVWPLFHSYAFDVSVWELWGSLFYGGRLVVVPYLVSRSPHDFYELLAREKVTVLNQTPSAFRQLIWAEETAETKRELQLRYVICAGEALELQSLKPWFDRHSDEKPKIVNMYGITEITVHATFRIIRKADLTSGVGSVVGVPIPDLKIYLVDEDMKLVPTGVPGEICVGGAGVARGYLNRPELNSKRFLSDPFSSEPGANLYRSGDLAQYSEKGELEYLGRMDHQVKIRGFRVELGEIESAINRHPTIRESVVIAQDDPSGVKRLIAYVVPVDVAPTVSDLRSHLEVKLPDYMVPAVFVFLASLPLTTNGKVDRRALPKPDGARPDLKQEFLAPRNPSEQLLALIWSEVLQVDKVGVNDNLFELGGDSIRSIAILSRARQNGLNLTLQQLFQNPTVVALAACAQTSTAESRPTTEPFSLATPEDRSKMPADVEDAYPISRLQMGMFFHNELDPASAMYHDVFSYCINSEYDPEKLECACQRLIDRHPVLRTSFHLVGYSEPIQLVHRSALAPVTVEDLRKLPANEQEYGIVQWIDLEKRRAFARTSAPLVRFHVQRLSDKSFQFILSFHHACLDGWSLAAVMTEIFQDYAALLQGTGQVIHPPRITYRDFVALERQAVESEETRRFWSTKLEDTSLQLMPRWPKSLCKGGHEQVRGPEIQISAEVFDGLKRVAQTAGVPLKTVLLAAHQKVMSFVHGQTDVISGVLCNGRPEDVDGEKLIGLFLNTLPIRLQMNGGSWVDLVKQTFTAEQEIIAHRRFPMVEIQKLKGGRPIFETAFDFVHFHVYKNLQATRNLDLAEGHYFEANDLTFFTTFMLDVTSTQLQMHMDYDPNSLCPQQIDGMCGYYVNTLRAMAASPQAAYEQFCPISDNERHLLLSGWNATEQNYPRNRKIHELFEERLREKPEATAIVCGSEKLSYRELHEKSEALAHRLRAAGVGSETLVGICMERSAEMMVGLLGIMKAGGAYVPLDPAYPKERLTFMVQDANLPVLLTQEKLRNILPASNAKVLSIDSSDEHRPVVTDHRTPVVDNPPAGTDSPLAYVIYTSGSTGNPKGVQVTHKAVVNLLASAARTLGFTAQDNLLAVTTLSFDIAGLELFMPLISGGQVTIATREQSSDGTQLAGLLTSCEASAMQGTPATWRLLIEAGWQGEPDLTIICGGEALKRNLADELLKRAREVWNFYGPTETTIWSTAWKVTPSAPISIGRPLANTQTYILDKNLQPVPIGGIGELHIGGDGLARGYLNRPQLTAEKFILNPFAAEPGGRMYKTGDLARHLPDGTIECLGRIDHQVKIRGFRIELGEVETVLKQHQGIADALVTACDDAVGEQRLVGYIISRNGPPVASELREFIRAKLPAYMVPAQFVVLKQFPLTPNGKVDVRRLPAPEGAPEATRTFVAPRTEDEQRLAQIWREVLLLKQVGIADNFFDLGADSLSATRAFARINVGFGIRISLRDIFEHPTIASLAEIIRKGNSRSTALNMPIPRRLRK